MMKNISAHKNNLTSYGLTLVSGLPLSSPVTQEITALTGQLEQLLPRRITWYAPEHLHITLAAPLRGRYRTYPPIQRGELPGDLGGFIKDLDSFLGALQPFQLDLSGLTFSSGGYVLVGVSGSSSICQQLAELIQKYPELDHSKTPQKLHLTLGMWNLAGSVQSPPEPDFSKAASKFSTRFIGAEKVDKVWLVHYSNRMLNKIVGKLSFPLGETRKIPAARFLAELGIES